MKNRTLLILSLLFLDLMAFKSDVPPTADSILQQALKQAKKEKKQVMVIFHASWCGWCHKMENSLNDPAIKADIDKNFVIKYLTVFEAKDKKGLENPGAEDMMKKYNSEGFGIPLWFIFDQDGKLLADSHIRPAGTGFETKGDNIIGCPASKEEVDEFVKILKQTTKLKDNELTKIAAVFRKNAPNFKQ